MRKNTEIIAIIAVCCSLSGSSLWAQTNPAPVGMQAPMTNATGTNGMRANRGGGRRGGGTDWAARALEDYNDLKVFANANAQLPPPAADENRVVFIGDSITENWQRGFKRYFPGKTNYIGRGRTSETTQQMLVRFRPDIIDLQPKAVVIMAGVNDIAENTGTYPQKVIEDDFKSMFDLAELNHIKVILISTLPANQFFWQRSVTNAADKVLQLDQWEKAYCAQRGIEYVDAYSFMSDDQHHMKQGLSMDSVHPTQQGYQMLSAPVEAAIEKVLGTAKQ